MLIMQLLGRTYIDPIRSFNVLCGSLNTMCSLQFEVSLLFMYLDKSYKLHLWLLSACISMANKTLGHVDHFDLCGSFGIFLIKP
jgi:hypothetical protein